MKRRVSLTTLFLLKTIVALALGLYSLSWRLKVAESLLRVSESRRYDNWPHPGLINAIADSTLGSSPGFRPARREANLGWRLQLPDDSRFYSSFSLHWETVDAEKISEVSVVPLLHGTSELMLRVFESANGELLLAWGNGPMSLKAPLRSEYGWKFIRHRRTPNRRRLSEGIRLFDWSGYVVSTTGLNDTESGIPLKPFPLFSAVEANPQTGRPRSFRLWIEANQPAAKSGDN